MWIQQHNNPNSCHTALVQGCTDDAPVTHPGHNTINKCSSPSCTVRLAAEMATPGEQQLNCCTGVNMYIRRCCWPTGLLAVDGQQLNIKHKGGPAEAGQQQAVYCQALEAHAARLHQNCTRLVYSGSNKPPILHTAARAAQTRARLSWCSRLARFGTAQETALKTRPATRVCKPHLLTWGG